MKSKVLPSTIVAKQEQKFPCLYQEEDGTIVLATGPIGGVVIVAEEDDRWPLGFVFAEDPLSATWAKSDLWRPLSGKLVVEFDV